MFCNTAVLFLSPVHVLWNKIIPTCYWQFVLLLTIRNFPTVCDWCTNILSNNSVESLKDFWILSAQRHIAITELLLSFHTKISSTLVSYNYVYQKLKYIKLLELNKNNWIRVSLLHERDSSDKLPLKIRRQERWWEMLLRYFLDDPVIEVVNSEDLSIFRLLSGNRSFSSFLTF